MRQFGPKSKDHPSVGSPCRRCGISFIAGDFTTLVGTDPADAEQAKKKLAGQPYIAVSEEIHWTCVTPQDPD